MRKSAIIALLAAVCGSIALIGCGDTEPPAGGGGDPGIITPGDVAVTGVSLDKSELTLRVGKTQLLTATVEPEDATDKSVIWSTDKPNVATVSNGRVVAVAEGTAVITARAGGKEATCTVTVVEEGEPVIEATKTAYAIGLDVTKTVTLEFTVGGKPAPTVDISCDKADYVDIDVETKTVTFKDSATEGLYTFTVTAENTIKTVTKTFTVAVRLDSDTYLDADFSADPGFTLNLQQGGTITFDEGVMNIATTDANNTRATAIYDFGAPLSGKVYASLRAKGVNPAGKFHNIFFLYDSSADISGDSHYCTVALGVEHHDGKDMLQYNNGKSWVQLTEVPNGEWYDVELLLDFDKAVMTLRVNGETVGTDLTFRHPEFKASTTKLIIGTDKKNNAFAYDALKIVKAELPTITLNSAATASIDLDDADASHSYIFDYDHTSAFEDDVAFDLDCDKESGYTVSDDGKTVTFVAAGTYVFTLTACDFAGSASATVTVTVTGTEEAPAVTVNSADAELSLQATGGAKYALDYAVTGSPVPTVTVSCRGGDTLKYYYDPATKTYEFFAPGEYEIEVSATNVVGSDQKTVTVTVTDDFALAGTIPEEMTVWTEDFSTPPVAGSDGVTTEIGNGALTMTDELHITTRDGTTNGRGVFFNKIVGTFAQLTSASFDFRFAHDLNSARFTNLAFFTNSSNPSKSQATNFAIDSGRFVYNLSNKWQVVQFGATGYGVGLIPGEQYTIRVVNDSVNKLSYLYLSGSKIRLLDRNSNTVVEEQALAGEYYLGQYTFRNPGTVIDTLRIGSEQSLVDLTVDNIRIYNITPGLSVAETAKAIHDFDGSSTYTLDYTAEAGAPVSVTCDKSEGFSIADDKKTVTFVAEGTYVFTITVGSGLRVATRTVTVTLDHDALVPGLSVEETSVSADFDGSVAEYTFVYTATNADGAAVEITCTSDNAAAVTVTGDKASFTAVGTYAFKLSLTTRFGTAEARVSVEVVDAQTKEAPVITATQTAEVRIQTNGKVEYTLDYTVTGSPTPAVTVACDKSEGFTLAEDKTSVEFTRGGVYVFTVSAANSEGSADKAITVTVLDAEYLLIHDSGAIGAETTEADLTAKGAQLSKSGGGSFAYDEKGVYIATSATSGSIWYDVAFPSSFDQSRDILTAELKFSVPAGLGQMINLFFISDASGNPVTCFAVDGAYKFVYSIESGNWTAFVHNGSQVIIEMDAEYTLKAICDFGAKKSYALLYKGEELVCAGTPFVFRTPNTTAAVFKSGIDNKSDVMYYLKSFVIMNDNRTYLVAASSGSAMIDEQNPTVSKDLAGYLLGVNGFTDKCTFTCDKTEGVTVDGDIATFSAEGDYLFTASCPTSAGLKTVSFTVSVKNYKPITMMWQDDFDAKPTDPSVTVTDNVVFTEADGRTVAQFNVDTDGAHTIMYYQEAEMTGTIVSEVTFMETKQTDNKYLMLTAFYKGKDTKTPVLTIGSANGYLKYNWYNPASKNDNKQEWTDLKVEGSSIRFATGQWYTLKVYTDLVNDKCYYFLSGDTITMRKEKVNYTVSVGTDKYLGESPFRNAANKPAHSVAVFCNDAVVHGNIDSVKLYKANAPIIEAPAALTVMGTSVDLAAYCFNADSSNITCNDASVGITGRVATFAKAGTYIFTVSAANEFATVTKEITVTVKDSDKTAVYNKNFVAEDFDLAAELALEGGMLKETNGTLTKDENGILIATTAEKKSPYADFDLSSLPTTGRIDIEIGFMIPTDNNQQINFGFLNDRNGGKNVACFLIRSSDDNILAHEGIDNGWFSMAYNGSNVRISKGHKYLMKLEIDLDKHFYYVFIKDEEGNTLGTGTDGYVALGKIVCRGLKAVPGVMKFGFDNKNAGAKLYLRSMNIQTLTEKTL